MSTQERRFVIIGLTLSVVALLVSLFAAFMTWDANRISREGNELSRLQMTASVVPISVSLGSNELLGVSEGRRRAACNVKVNLVNLGGAAAEIVGIDTSVHMAGQDQVVDTSPREVYALRPFSATINSFKATPRTNPVPSGNVADDFDFPVRIDAYSAVQLYVRIEMIADPKLNVQSPLMNAPGSIDEHSLVEADFVFRTLTGQQVQTPRTACLYVK